MSNFEKWKAAHAAFNDTEDEYNAAHNAVLAAGEKRAAAWTKLVTAAKGLTGAERAMAANFEFGLPAVASDQCGGG